MGYGSVVFDMDGVILNFEGDGFKWKYDAVRDALSQEGVDGSDFSRGKLDAFIGDKGTERFIEICSNWELDPATTWDVIAEKTSLARMEMIKDGQFSLYPEVKEVLDRLRDKEIELGLISNAPEKAVEVTVDHYKLRDHFKFFRGITSFEDSVARKPHPDHLVFAKAELKRPDYLYAGDAESDLIAARDAGMASVWVNRNGASLDVRPDYEIKELSDLIGLIK